jgi:hypothetical protein
MNTEEIQEIIARLARLEQRGKDIITSFKVHLELHLPQVSVESKPSSLRLTFFGAVLLVRVELAIGKLKGYIVSYWVRPEESAAKEPGPKLEPIQAYTFDGIGNVYLGPADGTEAELLEQAVPRYIGGLVEYLRDKKIGLFPE